MSSKNFNINNLSTTAVVEDDDYQELMIRWPTKKFAEMIDETDELSNLIEVMKRIQFKKRINPTPRCCHEHRIANFGVLKQCQKCG